MLNKNDILSTFSALVSIDSPSKGERQMCDYIKSRLDKLGIKYEEDDRNVTYSYTDILTRTVEVEVFDGVGYSPLIPPYQKEKSKRGRKVQLDNINVQPA